MKNQIFFVSFFSLIVFVFTTAFYQPAKILAHPFEGEVLSFKANNADAGHLFFEENDTVYFPYINKSGHDVVIKEIKSNNNSETGPYRLIGHAPGTVIKQNQADSVCFAISHNSSKYIDLKEGPYDHSWTVSFEGTEILQYLNIFCELEYSRGKIVVEPIVLPTVKRGEVIHFEAKIKNVGLTSVQVKPSYWSQHIKGNDSLPFTMKSGEERNLSFDIKTADLYINYDGSVYFQTEGKEDYSYDHFSIPYSGQLISENHASIKFDSTELSIYCTAGDEVLFHFWFTNDGDEPLIISMAKTSCGCLVASYPQEPIKPGERNEIKVKYDSNRVGPINKTCTVYSNASTEPKVLRVKGNISAKLVIGN